MKLGKDGEISGPILPDRNREIDRLYTDNNRKVVGARYAGILPGYQFLDQALQDSYDKLSAQLPMATIYMDSWSDDRSRVLYNVFDPALGDAWLVHTTADNGLTLIANSRPDIPVEAVGYMMNVEYKSTDDLSIQAIITAPPNYDPATHRAMPSIIMPHGGPASYDRFDFDWMVQYFANRGYLVVQPNFRGSTGFGREFMLAGRGEWGRAMQDDITEGVKTLASAGMLDPNRVCIAGASYGGYAALAGAVFTPDLYKCVIAIAPVSDLNMMLRNEKQSHGRDHWVVGYWEGLMADGDARREKLRAISPANFAENVTAPILLLHGNDDTVVPIAQSTKMRRELRSAGKSVELITLKGEDHWLSSADTRLQTLREMDRFIARHLPLDD
jgi:dipeptidyl aminopeptidase/acylaminoacyl peptidase